MREARKPILNRGAHILTSGARGSALGTPDSANTSQKIIAGATSLGLRLKRLTGVASEHALKSLAVLSALSILLGAIWSAAYYGFVAHHVPNVGLDDLPALLILLAFSGTIFLAILIFSIIGPGTLFTIFFSKMFLNADVDEAEIRKSAIEVFLAATVASSSLLLLFAGRLTLSCGLLALALTAVAMVSLEFRESKKAGKWNGRETLLPRVYGLFIAICFNIAFLAFIAIGIVPAGLRLDGTYHDLFLVVFLFALANFLSLLLALASLSRLAVVGLFAISFFVIIPIYDEFVLDAPFRSLRVGSYDAQLLLSPTLSNSKLMTVCFDRRDDLTAAYVLDSLGDTVVLATRKPGPVPSPAPSTSPSAGRQTPGHEETRPSATLKVPCVVSIPKSDIQAIVTQK